MMQFDMRLEKLLDKRGDIFNIMDYYRLHKIRQRDYFINLDADWLPYIHSRRSMENPQDQNPLQSKAPELNDKVSRPIGETSQSSEKNHHKENQDNEFEASSHKMTKKAEKLAALYKEIKSKMRLRRLDYEIMKQKELEMELHSLEERRLAEIGI